MSPHPRSLLPHLPSASSMSSEGSEEKNSLPGPVRDEKHQDHASAPAHAHVDNAISNVNARLTNPLTGLSDDQLIHDCAEVARAHGLGHLEELFSKGALAAQDPLASESKPRFTEAEKDIFRREMTHRWDHPVTLYYLAVLCSVAAAVQGVSGGCSRTRFGLFILSYLIRWMKLSSTAPICSMLHNSASTLTKATRANISGSSASSTQLHMYVCVAIASLKRRY